MRAAILLAHWSLKKLVGAQGAMGLAREDGAFANEAMNTKPAKFSRPSAAIRIAIGPEKDSAIMQNLSRAGRNF
jgi:hypothetical protein